MKPDPLRDKLGAELPEPPYVTGGPAFPAYPNDANADEIGHGGYGISILDYFAAHVINGLASRQNYSIDDLKVKGPQDAYWVAALMVDLRSKLPIEPTPVPSEETPLTTTQLVVPAMPPQATIMVGGAPAV